MTAGSTTSSGAEGNGELACILLLDLVEART